MAKAIAAHPSFKSESQGENATPNEEANRDSISSSGGIASQFSGMLAPRKRGDAMTAHSKRTETHAASERPTPDLGPHPSPVSPNHLVHGGIFFKPKHAPASPAANSRAFWNSGHSKRAVSSSSSRSFGKL